MEKLKINHYQIIEKIAEGGMGIVYRAIDTKKEKVVALKTLKTTIDTHNEAFLRFRKEAELLESLKHPYILQFIDFIEKENKLFIITEWIEGKNLKQLIHDPSFDITKKIVLIKNIAEALDYVHSQGIIHRDIKPSNIMVTQDETPKILDFGIANLADFQNIFSGAVAGSFSYMSPEQSGILRRNIDNRSDLYSLGILFYELLTGVLPYQAKEVGELLHQHIAKTPEEPSNLVKDLSPIINKIVLKLIKKDPDDRYQTAFGLAEDLKTFLSLNEEQKKTFYLELGKKDRLKNLNYRTSLIGRKNELKHLLEHLNNTVLNKGFISVVIGKSGIGKSRLISEIQKYTASKNALYLSVTASKKAQDQPYAPLIDAVTKLLDLLSKLPAKIKNDIYEKIVNKIGKEGKILSKIIPSFIPLIGEWEENIVPKEKESELFLEKLKDFFLAVASPTNPLVFVMDDIHFWDQASILFLSYMKNFIENHSIFMILAMREEEISTNKELYETLLQAAKEGKAGILNLQNLGREEIELLVQEVFGGSFQGLSDLCARIYEATQGNTLLIIENIKTLVEEEVLVLKNESWVLNYDKLSLFRISSSIIDKIVSRLLKIKNSTQQILTQAAVLGKDFTFEILFHTIQFHNPDFKKEELLDALQEGVEKQLIIEVISEKGEIGYSFAHDKVIEALLNQMDEKKIQEMHKIAASVIEKYENKEDKIYKLAYHYWMSNSYDKAFEYNLLAGKKAAVSFSYRLAMKFFLNALHILKNFSPKNKKNIKKRIELTLDIVQINFQLGDIKNNILLLEELLPILEQNKEQKALAKVYYLLGKNFYFAGDQAKAMAYYYRVIPLAESLNMPELLAIPYVALGRANCYIANFREAVDYIKRGLNLLPKSETLEQIYSLGILAQSLAAMGEKKEALQTIEKLKREFAQIENPLFELYIVFFGASVEVMVGEPQKAFEEAERCLSLARELKNIGIEINSLFNLGRAYSLLGKWTEAVKYMTRAIQLAKENNIMLGLFMLSFSLAEMLAIGGQIKQAKEVFEEGEKWTGIGNPLLVDQWKNRLKAVFELYSHSPNFEIALEHIEKAIVTSEKMGQGYEVFFAYNLLTKAALYWRMNKNKEAEEIFLQATHILNKKDLQNDLQVAKNLKLRFAPSTVSSPHYTTTTENEMHSTFSTSYTQTEFSYQRQLKYLLRLSEQISKVYDMENLLKTIMALAIEVSGAERGILFLYEEKKNKSLELEIKAKKSIDPNEETNTMVYSQLAIQKTLKSGKGELIIDAQNELGEEESVKTYQMKSIITVPLSTSGKILGVIYLDNRQVKGLFTEENFELLKAFAVQAAISIENAKLYAQIQEKARIEQEMEIAKDIQTSILPSVKDTPHYEISAFMRTASEVGGDYYDLYLEEAPYFGVFGDVSGHGLKSGLIMMMAEVAFNTLMQDQKSRQEPLPHLYQKINRTLYTNIQERLSEKSKLKDQYSYMYMTFRIFRFDDQGNFEIFGNDHAEPFVCRKEDGNIETFASTGFLLGMAENAVIKPETTFFQLKPGDILVLYSDGITEAKKEAKVKVNTQNRERLLFGEQRLFQVIQNNRNKPLPEIISTVVREVDNWMAEQEDDITILLLRKK